MSAPSIRQRCAAAWSFVGPGLRRAFIPFFAKVAFIVVATLGAFAGHQLGANVVCRLAEPLAASVSTSDPLLKVGGVSFAGSIPGEIVMGVCVGTFTMAGLTIVMIALGVVLSMIMYRRSLRTGA